MAKKSFFERLTGAVDDDYTEDFESETNTPLEINSDDSLGRAEENWLNETEEEGELTVDMYQTPDDIIIRTLVAGVRPEDIDIDITRDMVTIKGTREEARVVDEEDYYNRELYWGSFSRKIVLPQEIDVEESEANEKHGLLVLRLPKIDKTRKTKIKVKSN